MPSPVNDQNRKRKALDSVESTAKHPRNDLDCNGESSSVMNPKSHTCFGKTTTVYDFAQTCDVHNVNNLKIQSIRARACPLKCEDCSKKMVVTVGYSTWFCMIKRTI